MIRKKFVLIGLGAIFLFSLSQCGGNALPQQASIPPPADDCSSSGSGCITVSSDSTTGQLTITGDVGAVPASAIVIVSVEESSSSSINPFNILDWIIPNAMAGEVCSSSLPECSQETELTSCQITANEDGSFLVQVFSDATTLTINYLDPDNDCEESESFETEVSSSNLQTLEIEGYFLTNNELNTVYIFGTNADANENILIPIEVDTHTSETTIGDSINLGSMGTPIDFDYLFTSNQLVLTIDGNVRIAETDGTLTGNITDNSTKDPLRAIATAVQKFTYSSFIKTDADFSCIENISSLAGTTVDRIFFAREDLGDNTNFVLSVLDSGDHTEARTISYDFTGTELENSTIISARDLIISLDGSHGFVITEFEDKSGVASFYLIGIPLFTSGFCFHVIASDQIIIKLDGLEDPGKVFWIGHSNIESEDTSASLLVIPDQGDNPPIVVNLNTGEVNSLSDLENASDLERITKIIPLTFHSPLSFAGISQSVTLNEFSLNVEFDNDLGIRSLSISDFSSSEKVGINTTDMTLLITASFTSVTDLLNNLDGILVTLSGGLEEDGLSYIRAMSLSDLLEE